MQSISGPLWRESTEIHMAPAIFLSCRGMCHSSFLVHWSHKVRSTWPKMLSSAACWKCGPLIQLHVYQLSFVNDFLHSLSFTLIPLHKIKALLGGVTEITTSFITFNIIKKKTFHLLQHWTYFLHYISWCSFSPQTVHSIVFLGQLVFH